uniref:ADAM10 endopeptidase n=1 Tax=Aceria tosichella TaxID=561515 RepID=A0A6G1S4U6_9ACAR
MTQIIVHVCVSSLLLACSLVFSYTQPEASKTQNNILNQHISHFEPLNYNHHYVHKRAKRSIEQEKPDRNNNNNHNHNNNDQNLIEINFRAHNRDFKLRLRPDVESVFAKGAIIEDSQGDSIKHNINQKLVSLTGHLHDEPHDSLVFGSLKKGVFEGRIHTADNNVYYVERSRKYLDDLKEHNTKFHNVSHPSDLSFHSVIYSAKDVKHPHLDTAHSHIDHLPTLSPSCGEENGQVKSWMKQVAESAVPGSEKENLKKSPNDDAPKTPRELFYERMSQMYKYSPSGITHVNNTSPIYNNYNSSPQGINSRDNWVDTTCQSDNTTVTRVKREAADIFDFTLLSPKPRISHRLPSEQSQRQKRACTLYIQTDTYLWNHTRRHHDNDLDTREDIASLVAQHIKAVNHIYENSDFGGIRGLKFIVQRLRINDTVACEGSKRTTNPFCHPNIDVSNFLNLNSQFNHNDFCLAYIFTYRDFTGGTLGLAWVASTSGASGGICEKYKSYTENINQRQIQTKRSLNTGIITFVNYNSRVPPKVSELTLAHEIGHNFGSPHDYPADCRPGGPQGNYIMFQSATSGERSNNNKFSSCSIRNISAVLHAVLAADSKDNCFEVDNGPFCGNKIVEEGEQCDCGYNAQECTEQCCVPREVSLDIDYGGSRSCQRIRGKECSPSEGPCCSDDCSFAGREKLCRQETECSHQQTCDATQASCPEPTPKPNMTECNNGTQVCMNGKCGGSICMKYQMEECFLTSKAGAKPEDMCEVACQQRDKPNTCRRTSEIPEMKHMSGLKLRPGSPCNEFIGYCDVFQKCRPVDAEGPLARLKYLILNERTLTSIKQWAITHWWACALFAIAFMMLMYVFIECCAVHTPTSNPKKKPAVRIIDTIRHPASTLRRKRHVHGRELPNGRPNEGYLFRA